MLEYFNEMERDYLSATAIDGRRNLREVVEAISEINGIGDVDVDNSVAAIHEGKLLISIVHGQGQHLAKILPIDSVDAQTICDFASRRIADSMRDHIERLRIIETQ
ncbi:hypothetical protein D3C78_19010 [compost metagenome]